MAFIWPRTHPIVIYRGSVERKHDLSVEVTTEAIASGWGRLLPDDDTIWVGEMGLTEERASLWVPRGELDIDIGYGVKVEKPRVLNGQREATADELAAAATAGDYELSVYYAYGFDPGDQILLDDGTNNQLAKIRSVDDLTLTIYESHKLRYSFVVGTPITACSFWNVIGVRREHSTEGLFVVALLEEAVGLGTMG